MNNDSMLVPGVMQARIVPLKWHMHTSAMLLIEHSEHLDTELTLKKLWPLILFNYAFIFLVYCFCTLPQFQRYGSTVQESSRAGDSKALGPGIHRPGESKNSSSKRKRRKNNKSKKNTTGEESDGQSNDESGGGIANQATGLEDPEQPGLLCPYVFLNPILYFDCFSHPCKDYDRMKLHLSRKHRISDHYCPICFAQFITEEELEAHSNPTSSDDRCVAVTGHDGITLAEWDDVFNPNRTERNNSDKCPRSKDDERKWFWMWRQLFNGHQPPSSIRSHGVVAILKKALFKLETVQTIVRQAYVSTSQQDPEQLALRIHSGLMNTENGPWPYRVYHQHPESHQSQQMYNYSAFDISEDLLGPEHEELQALNVQPMDSYQPMPGPSLLGPNGMMSSAGNGILTSPEWGTLSSMDSGLAPVPVKEPSATPAEPAWNGMAIDYEPMPTGPLLGAAAAENMTTTRSHLLTSQAIWEAIKNDPISANNSSGPRWESAEDCVDMGRLQMFLVIPILDGQADRFRALEAGGSVEPWRTYFSE